MKTVLFAVLVTMVGSSAFADVSCMSNDEAAKLAQIQFELAQAKINRPDCEHWRGAGACLSPFNESYMNYLLLKQEGNPDVCKH